ncbi:unnamed protein product [Caenorhabditis brenneri]
MVGQFPRDHRNTYSEGSPNVQHKPHQLTKSDWDFVRQYMADLQNTGRPSYNIPPHIWNSLLGDKKQEIKALRARNPRPQRKNDDTSYQKEAGKTRTHSMSHGHNERHSMSHGHNERHSMSHGHNERHSMSHGHNERSSMSHGHNERSSYNGRPPRQPRTFVDTDPNDPLSDDAFTQQYEPDYWARLPKRVRYEIERQRFVKKERAKKAAADQSSTLN